METQPDLCDPLSSFSPCWQFSRAQELNPSSPLVSNKVYSIPSLPGGLLDTHKLDKKVLAKAASLSLHPRQEHMRLNIARSLVAHKPCSPRNKFKMSLLNIKKALTLISLYLFRDWFHFKPLFLFRDCFTHIIYQVRNLEKTDILRK